MSYEVEILADSVVSTAPHRLTTFRLKYPALIHAEDLRHRMRSWSVSSMRAIPLAKQIERVMTDPVMPVHWGSAKPGMQAGEELTGENLKYARDAWLAARDACVAEANVMNCLGLHKQVASRILQPWSHYEMVTTGIAPAWMNFFTLRCHSAAQPEMRRLAVRMALAYRDSVPYVLAPGHWHLPYVTAEELYRLCQARGRVGYEADPTVDLIERNLLKLSVARCGRVSFLHHGETDRPVEKDFEFHDARLKAGDFSVFEHQARAPRIDMNGIREPITRLEGNLTGWIQYRQLLQTNVHTDFDFSILDQFEDDWPMEDDFRGEQIIAGECEPR